MGESTITEELAHVLALVEEVESADVTFVHPGVIRFVRFVSYKFIREHGRTLLEALRDVERAA